MSVVREPVASLESHGRQLRSELGHMARLGCQAGHGTVRGAGQQSKLRKRSGVSSEGKGRPLVITWLSWHI